MVGDPASVTHLTLHGGGELPVEQRPRLRPLDEHHHRARTMVLARSCHRRTHSSREPPASRLGWPGVRLNCDLAESVVVRVAVSGTNASACERGCERVYERERGCEGESEGACEAWVQVISRGWCSRWWSGLGLRAGKAFKVVWR